MEELAQIAVAQGFITHRDAVNRGYDCNALTRLVTGGRLIHPLRGVYLPVSERTPEALHALVTLAVLHDEPDAVASQHSALALAGVPLYGIEWARVHVAEKRRCCVRCDRVHRHRLRDDDPVVEVEGVRALAPALAAVQVAAACGVEAGLVSMDALLHAGTVQREELLAVVDSGRIRRGLPAARLAVAQADARAESPGESRLRYALMGTPWHLEPQAPIGPYEVDMLVDGLVILEFDGEGKYDERASLIAEKRREDVLRSYDYGVVRVTWAMLAHPTALAIVIRQELDKVRARRAR